MSLLDTTKYKCTVSSVLNKDVKQHGKHFMFDGVDDSAWSSSEGSSQWILLSFDDPQLISKFSIQFQGGFACKFGSLEIESKDGKVTYEQSFQPDDVNSIQTFELKTPATDVYKIKFIFNDLTDFFGRIIVYKLHLFDKLEGKRTNT